MTHTNNIFPMPPAHISPESLGDSAVLAERGIIEKLRDGIGDNPALQRHVTEIELINSGLRVERDELRAETTTDKLAGLPNLKGFRESVIRIMGVSLRSEISHADGDATAAFGFVMADLDKFKNINDIEGHDAGDRTISMIGQALKSTITSGRRQSDVFARLHGDEFAGVTTVSTDKATAEVMRFAWSAAEAIDEAVQSPRTPSYLQDLGCSASFGVTVVRIGKYDNFEEEYAIGMKDADTALRAAKDLRAAKIDTHARIPLGETTSSNVVLYT